MNTKPMTEREKQIEAIAKCIKAYEGAAGNISNLRHKCIMEILDALAPWLKEPEHTERFHAEVSDHGKRLMMLEDFARKTEDLINSPLCGILKRLRRLEPLPKPEAPAPTADRYSVSIMRAKGSKWHEIATHHDWVTAIERADNRYGDPEIQAVQVFANDKDETVIYLKRKP